MSLKDTLEMLQVFTGQGNFSDERGDGPAECEGADKGEGEFWDRGERDREEEVLDPKHKNIMNEVDAVSVGGEGFPDAGRSVWCGR